MTLLKSLTQRRMVMKLKEMENGQMIAKNGFVKKVMRV
jgi:hypothetical protein